MALIRNKECTFVEEYCVAPSPGRDYYGLKVTDQQVLLYVWKVTRGAAGHPAIRSETLADFLRNTSIQNEISRIFGDDIVAQAVAIARGERSYLPHLPQSILHRILLHVDIADIARVAQVCTKLQQVTNNNSLWQMLYQNLNSGPPTPEQKKRATLVGWKRLFRSSFKGQSAHRITSTSSSVVASKPRKKTSGVAGNASKPTEKMVSTFGKLRGRTQTEGNRKTIPDNPSYVAKKLQEIAAQRNKPEVEVLFTAASFSGESRMLHESVSTNSVCPLTEMTCDGLRADDPPYSAKQVVTRTEKTLDAVACRDGKTDTVVNKSSKLSQESKGPDELYSSNSENNSFTTVKDKHTNVPSDGVNTYLLGANSKRPHTARNESQSTGLKESDGLLDSSRQSSKVVIRTSEVKKPNTSRACDKPTSLADIGKITSEKHSVAKNMPAMMSEVTRDKKIVSSRKSSKVNHVVLDKNIPQTPRKEGTQSALTNKGKATINKVHEEAKTIRFNNITEAERNRNTAGSTPGSSRKSSTIPTTHPISARKTVTKSAKESISKKQAKKLT